MKAHLLIWHISLRINGTNGQKVERIAPTTSRFNEVNCYDIRLIACAIGFTFNASLHYEKKVVNSFFFVLYSGLGGILFVSMFLSKTMLMRNKNIVYELFWHLIFAKNMLRKKIVHTIIMFTKHKTCQNDSKVSFASVVKIIQTYSNLMYIFLAIFKKHYTFFCHIKWLISWLHLVNYFPSNNEKVERQNQKKNCTAILFVVFKKLLCHDWSKKPS